MSDEEPAADVDESAADLPEDEAEAVEAESTTGWRPDTAETYYGYEVWDHDNHAPHEVNGGEVDPDWKVDPED